MELDERKKKILLAVIKTYLETGEPVGSRTISKFTDLNLSSATIRNEMADLEEMGYIMQPHTSAGRIPSDKGYRFYVDQLMEDKEREVEEREREVDEMKDILVEKADKMEDIIVIYERISDVTYEIESYESRMRTYDDQIAYSTVNISVEEVERETQVVEETAWQEIVRRLGENLEDIGDSFKEFFIGQFLIFRGIIIRNIFLFFVLFDHLLG